jgi:hypothetical protein
MDVVPFVNDPRCMERLGLIAVAVLTGFVSLALLVLPSALVGYLMALSPEIAADFLVRRYAVSATAGLCVAALMARTRAPAAKAVYGGVSAWFAVQGAVALWAVISGVAGGAIWLALVADPVLAMAFFVLSRRVVARTA